MSDTAVIKAVRRAVYRKRRSCILCLHWGTVGRFYGCRNGHRAKERTLRIDTEAVMVRREDCARTCCDYQQEV